MDKGRHLSALPINNCHYTLSKTPSGIHQLYVESDLNVLDDSFLTYDTSLQTSWRLQIKRWLIRNFSLFGINNTEYSKWNNIKKLVLATQDQNINQCSALLSHNHCTHCDNENDKVSINRVQTLNILVRNAAVPTSTDEFIGK